MPVIVPSAQAMIEGPGARPNGTVIRSGNVLQI
jgi:hypothetical protein